MGQRRIWAEKNDRQVQRELKCSRFRGFLRQCIIFLAKGNPQVFHLLVLDLGPVGLEIEVRAIFGPVARLAGFSADFW